MISRTSRARQGGAKGNNKTERIDQTLPNVQIHYRFGLLLTTDPIPKPNLPATWGRSEGRNERSRVLLNILEREKLIMELYPPQIAPRSPERTDERTNTRTGKNEAVHMRSLLRKCAFGAKIK